MEIDKSKGKWLDNATLLQDYAYQLYTINYNPLMYDNVNVGDYVTQEDFNIINKFGIGVFNEHFNNAKLILRREKIEKILNR